MSILTRDEFIALVDEYGRTVLLQDVEGEGRRVAEAYDAALARIAELEKERADVEKQWSLTAEEWCARAEERGRDAGYREGLDAAADRYSYP